MKIINLVADIGGTNLRIGILNTDGVADDLTVYQCAEYSGLAEIVNHYLERFVTKESQKSTINACFAIACPVENDLINMTNLPWKFSKKELKAELGLARLDFINDYTAIAHAVPFLTDSQKVQVGGGQVVANKPISICGPGTGLGVANVVPASNESDSTQWLSLGGEGGHADFAPVDETEMKILMFLQKKYSRVSYEQLLSGLGLEQIYQALMDIRGEIAQPLTAKDISTKALDKSCDVCQQTLAKFCEILGSFAGNLSLTLASLGGVYIAGGIVPRFIEYFNNSDFRQRFEAKGRFKAFNSAIATFVITESQPGILGASAYLSQMLAQESNHKNLINQQILNYKKSEEL
jgi:glucokinase